MKSEYGLKRNIVLILLFVVACPLIYSEVKLEPYIEIELQRWEELYNLLDTFAGNIWPGWDNYLDVEFQIHFPNLVEMIVNPREQPAQEYQLVQGRTVRGKKIYISRRKELSRVLNPPLGKGGGALGGRVYINLETFENAPKPGAFNKENFMKLQDLQSDIQLLTYVHELFHEYQTKAWSYKKEGNEPAKKTGENVPAIKKEAKRVRLNVSKLPPIYILPLEYACCKDIEGRALLAAYREKDDKKAVEYLKDAFVARELRHKHMPEREIAFEIQPSVGEGTAMYAQVKIAQLIRDSGYHSRLCYQKDPYFFDYRFMDEYFQYWVGDRMEQFSGDTINSNGLRYFFGMFHCFLLDRFMPGWKEGFLENSRTLDDMIGQFLQLNAEEKQNIEARLKIKYPFDEIVAKHKKTIQERDDDIALFEGRKGKKYIMDWTETKVLFPEITPRGRWHQLAYRRLYPHGIDKMTFGDVELTSKDTPMDKSWIYYMEWVDGEAGEGEKGYSLTYKEKTNDVYKDAVFTTKGFTLKAPEIRIEEKPDEIWIDILIAKKAILTPRETDKQKLKSARSQGGTEA